jgi:hypothetical protein
MSFPIELNNPAQANGPPIVNEMFEAIAASAMYARNYNASTGLVLGYFGGHIAGSAIADGTTTLAASEANVYVVAHRTTGAVTSATNTTNWDNVATYGRLYKGATSGSAITALEDWRFQPGGIFDQAAPSGFGDGGTNPHLRFTSDTGSTADSDPGSGLFKWNNGTQASATVIFIDDNEASGQAVTTFIGQLEPGGYLFLQQADDATRWQHWRITSITDASGYTKFGVSLLAKGSDIQDDKACTAAISTGVCETWAFACSDYKTTALTAVADVGGMIAPYAATVFNVWAGLHTAQTSGSTLTVDVNEGTTPTSILSSKITFDNTENWSGDDASLPVISDASIAAGAKITADVDAVGDGTAKGLTVYLRVFRT